MIGPVLKVLACFATTAVAVPYTTALLCNLAYGWPQIRHKYRRAFNPRKVYALNLAAIQQLILVVRFLPLYLQFRAFYKSASSSVILKVKYQFYSAKDNGTQISVFSICLTNFEIIPFSASLWDKFSRSITLERTLYSLQHRKRDIQTFS